MLGHKQYKNRMLYMCCVWKLENLSKSQSKRGWRTLWRTGDRQPGGEKQHSGQSLKCQAENSNNEHWDSEYSKTVFYPKSSNLCPIGVRDPMIPGHNDPRVSLGQCRRRIRDREGPRKETLCRPEKKRNLEKKKRIKFLSFYQCNHNSVSCGYIDKS